MNDTRDCEECARLWRAFSLATTTHIELVNRQQAAYMGRDFGLATRLEAEIARAGEERQAAGDAVYQHEVERHGRFAASANQHPARTTGGS